MEEENTNMNVNRNGALSEETEKLLKRYLKLEIASRVWSGIFRILILVFMLFSVIFSTTTLLPLVTKQLGALGQVYGMPANADGGINLGSVNDIMQNLTDEQKELIIKQVKGASISAEGTESADEK